VRLQSAKEGLPPVLQSAIKILKSSTVVLKKLVLVVNETLSFLR
jgi:hypothetical protein